MMVSSGMDEPATFVFRDGFFVGLALALLYGQTSWHASQPKILLPICLWNSFGIGALFSIVR